MKYIHYILGISRMGLNFGDEVNGTEDLSIGKSKFGAALKTVHSVLERQFTRLLPAVSDSVLLHDPEYIIIRNNVTLGQKGSELKSPSNGGIDFFRKT